MTNKQLIKKLENAYVVCRDCGLKYGVYSVGCSSVWEGKCDVCEQTKPITEARDYSYLVTGIRKLKLEDGAKTRFFSELTKDFTPERKEKIKQQSKEVAEYMFTQTQESEHDTRLKAIENLLTKGPQMTDEDLDRVMNPSYMQGDIECKFTEEEIGFLHECLDTIGEFHSTIQSDEAGIIVPEDVAIFESVEKKITELYQDHCVKYELLTIANELEALPND